MVNWISDSEKSKNHHEQHFQKNNQPNITIRNGENKYAAFAGEGVAGGTGKIKILAVQADGNELPKYKPYAQ